MAVFLDNHSTTRCDPRVVEAMLPFFTEDYGNAASRSHRPGWAARDAVEAARREVGRLIGSRAPSREIVFTSGATESDNLAVKGVARRLRDRGDHVITQATEHPAVLDPAERLREEGFRVTVLGVDDQGRVDPEDVRRAIDDRTLLVSVMLANNEIGTVQPLAEIGAITRERGVLFHVDAVQGIGHLDFDVEAMGVDLASLSAHKFHGPKGVGALFLRRARPKVRLRPEMDGGGHEGGLRSGTLNVPGIVGMGRAASLLVEAAPAETRHLAGLRDRLFAGLREAVPEIALNGPPLGPGRHPGNLHVAFPGVAADGLLAALSDVLAASTGSACASGTPGPSHVLAACGVPPDRAAASVRFGVGRFTTAEEIDAVVARIAEELAGSQAKGAGLATGEPAP